MEMRGRGVIAVMPAEAGIQDGTATE